MSSFTPLFGTDADSPHCYLLRIGAYNILLDCGWNDDFDTSVFQSINVPIDCVLLSHSSTAHIGGLPYLFNQNLNRSSIPILATLPVRRMGELTMYDSYQQWMSDQSINPSINQLDDPSIGQFKQAFTLDDIDRAFAAITTVKYSEDFQLERKIDDTEATTSQSVNQSITVTPHPSGHSIGGTVWAITVDQEPILYAVSYHHARERHVESGVIEAFQRPALLIADMQTLAPSINPSINPLTNQPNNQVVPQSMSRRAREQMLCQTIQSTLVERRGIVLLPTDSASRLLELLCVVCAYFDDQAINQPNGPLSQIPLILCSHTCHTVLDYARVQLEWMSEALQRYFDQSRANPFEMKRLILCQSMTQINQLTNHFTRPAVIFATNETLSTGLSLDLFERVSQSPNNQVILTLNAPSNSLAAKLRNLANAMKQPSVDQSSINRTVEYVKRVKTPLTTSELVVYEKALQQSINQSKLESEHTSIKQEESETINQSINDDETLITAMIDEDDEATAQPIKTVNPAAEQSMFYVFPAYQGKTTTQMNDFFGLTWSPPVFDGKNDDTMQDDEKQAIQPIGQTQSRFPHKPSVKEEPSQSINHSHQPIQPPAIPTKMVPTNQSISVMCSISSIDMTGLSDERAWRNVIGQVKPRKLILIHGGNAEKERFKSALIERGTFTSQNSSSGQSTDSTTSAASDLLIPLNRVSIPLASEQLFRASLHPSLLTQLRFSAVNEFAVAHLRATLRYGEQAQDIPQLVPPSINQSITSANQRPSSYFLGEYKFAEIRRLLSQHGIDSEYYVKGGVLVAANGTVRIRKSSPTQISIQGVVSEQYFTIRALLYRNHTQI